ncbi:MAG: ArsR/SmtB family transcription factor [Desulfomonilaceae bacterium]
MELLLKKSSENRDNKNGIPGSQEADSFVDGRESEALASAKFDNEFEDLEDKDQMFLEIKKKEFSREAEIFKALGHPIRLKIVYGLLKVGGCNVKNMQECLGLHQATVSQHLIHLKSRGIITSERQGLEMVYTVNNRWAKCIIDNIEKNQNDPNFT